MINNLAEVFEKFDDEYLKFEDIKTQLSSRRDLHALMLLDKLCPGEYSSDSIVGGAEHDEIYLNIDIAALEAAAEESDILDLIRGGVRYDEDGDALRLFV